MSEHARGLELLLLLLLLSRLEEDGVEAETGGRFKIGRVLPVPLRPDPAGDGVNSSSVQEVDNDVVGEKTCVGGSSFLCLILHCSSST